MLAEGSTDFYSSIYWDLMETSSSKRPVARKDPDGLQGYFDIFETKAGPMIADEPAVVVVVTTGSLDGRSAYDLVEASGVRCPPAPHRHLGQGLRRSGIRETSTASHRVASLEQVPPPKQLQEKVGDFGLKNTAQKRHRSRVVLSPSCAVGHAAARLLARSHRTDLVRGKRRLSLACSGLHVERVWYCCILSTLGRLAEIIFVPWCGPRRSACDRIVCMTDLAPGIHTFMFVYRSQL